MGSEAARPDAPEALLASLEDRARADGALAAEWAEAWTAWPRSAGDRRAEARFREWFLLEREARALGAPPAAFWAPRELGERDEDPWTRLLEAQFRILRVEASGPGGARLRDLWSGQAFEGVPLPDEAGAARLLFGRIAPRGEHGGRLLPGWRALADPSLADALAADLAQARAEQPRARLSQRECELLLVPRFAGLEEADAAAAAAGDETDYPSRLAELLASAPGWNLERALALIRDGGPAELLDRIAFETGLPLDPFRELLAEWAGAEASASARARPPETPADAADAALEPGEVARALAEFERVRAGGGDLDEALGDLRRALRLEPDEALGAAAEWSLEGPAMGPDSLPGLDFWIETWIWERGQAGRPVPAEESAAARELAAFLEALHEGKLDAAEVRGRDLWSHLAASRDAETLAQRQRRLQGWIAWLREEQGAFEHDDPAAWSEADRERLRASVALNAGWRAERRGGATSARLAAIDPPRVRGEEGELAPVLGVAAEQAVGMRAGDLLLGGWEAGSFRISAWLPGCVTAGAASPETAAEGL